MQEDKIIKRIPTNLVTKKIITSSAEYVANKEYTDEDANVYEKYLQAITKVSIGINGDIEKIKALEDNILEQYNKNVELEKKMEQETEKFAKQANTAIEDYNSNAETKIEEFNTNAKEKTEEFNSNAIKKTAGINTVSENFKEMAETKTTEFNKNANTKTEEFNNNSTEKINAFDSNAETQTETFNTNATEKTTAFDTNATQLTTQTDDLFDALTTNEASGTELYIDDAKACRVINSEIDGMYQQETTSGINIYNTKLLTTVTQNGITRTILPDGGIKVEGTATEQWNMRISTTDIVSLKEGNYTFVCYGLPTNLSVNIYYISNVTGESIKSFNSDGTKVYHMELVIPKATTVNCTLYPFLVNGQYDSATIPQYEPYTGGNPSPNPDYPQAIEQVESVKLNINNKNLFNKNIGIVYGKHYSLKNGELEDYVSDWYQENYINAKPNTTYSISVDGNTTGWLRALEYDANKNFLVGHNFYKFTTDSRCRYLRLSAGKSKLEKLQLEIGEIITEYSEYGLFLSNIDLQGNKLCAISDTVKDKLLIDRKGNVALQKNVDSINMKETNYNWQNASEAEEGYTAFFTSNLYSILKPNEGLICNCFTYLKYDSNNGFKVKKSNEAISDGGGYKRLYFRLKTGRLETNDIAGFRKFLKDNNIIVYYSLATPEIIDLGQLTELPKTFNGINNIWAETNLGNTEIEIEYVQDVKKLLEKQAEQQNARLDNIEALLSTTETSALLLDNMQNDLESEVE